MLIQERRAVMTSQYLPLTEYSNKYKVSISTLRRRIKADDLQFVFEDGKYLILDGPLSTHQRVHRPSPKMSEETLMGAQNNFSGAFASPTAWTQQGGPSAPANPAPQVPEEKQEEPVLAVANRLLTELKKAYSQILHEKEEQILHLKSELSDIKTLVRVLESENERLNKFR
jgi:hypothetical protein